MNLQRVEIVAHSTKPRAAQLRDQLAAWLEGRGIATAEDDPDLVVSLGGDGTILRAARRAHAVDAPLLGVNLGRMGYLNEVDAGEEEQALERICNGEFDIEDRMMLACRIVEGATVNPTDEEITALNEVLVERKQRLIRLLVSIGGDRLAAFNADGVLVASPTGSTAYALSAGGPIVSPRTECLVLVPVNAHMIFSRPFVLAPDESVEIEVEECEEPASLWLDGAVGRDVPLGARVLIRRHPRRLRLVRLSGPGFLERLRSKLNLPR